MRDIGAVFVERAGSLHAAGGDAKHRPLGIVDGMDRAAQPISQCAYGIALEQVVGSALGVRYAYDANGEPVLIKEPTLLINHDKAGKPEGFHLEIGARPAAAFENSIGEREAPEYDTAGARLGLLVLHDGPLRERAFGPARGLPDARVGAIPSALDDEARRRSWRVVSMKTDWKGIFSFDA